MNPVALYAAAGSPALMRLSLRSDADLNMPSGRSSYRHLATNLQNSYQLGSKDFIPVYQVLAKVRRSLAEQPCVADSTSRSVCRGYSAPWGGSRFVFKSAFLRERGDQPSKVHNWQAWGIEVSNAPGWRELRKTAGQKLLGGESVLEAAAPQEAPGGSQGHTQAP